MTVASRTEFDRPLLAPRQRTILLAVSAAGLAAFTAGVVLDAPRAWGVLLVNFLFWSGLGHAGVVFSAIFQASSARWARPLKRIAEASVAFLPVAAVLLAGLLAGLSAWMPWVHEPVEGKEAWLNVPFLVARQTAGFLLLAALSVRYVQASIRPDIGLLREAGRPISPLLARWCLTGWRGLEAERAASQRRQSRLSPPLIIVYACVLSLQAFDFVMSLDPHWFSTLVGGYLFVGNLYIGIAFLAIAAVWTRSRLALEESMSRGLLHDLGRALLGFCMLWAYLFWAQYLVIWYGDLPEEIEFVAHRTVDSPWAPLSWLVLAGAFAVPFVILLSREIKRHSGGLFAVAVLVFVAMWLERFVLVQPSIWRGDELPIGPVELLVTAGVGAAFVLCYAAFLDRVPVLPVADPLLSPTSPSP